MSSVPRALQAPFIVILVAALASASCGPRSTDPSEVKPGGTVTGRYQLSLVPAASCGGRAVSFLVEVTRSATSPHPGVQLLLVGADPAQLELELENSDNRLEGGIGTTGDGVLSSEKLPVWVNAIASGGTTQTSDGRGEVKTGTLRGFLGIEGVMDDCTSPNHSFTLRAQ